MNELMVILKPSFTSAFFFYEVCFQYTCPEVRLNDVSKYLKYINSFNVCKTVTYIFKSVFLTLDMKVCSTVPTCA